MVLSFLAGSKHAPVYASSEMYVVFLFVFAGSTCALVVLICSRVHLELPVGVYMQRFFRAHATGMLWDFDADNACVRYTCAFTFEFVLGTCQLISLFFFHCGNVLSRGASVASELLT